MAQPGSTWDSGSGHTRHCQSGGWCQQSEAADLHIVDPSHFDQYPAAVFRSQSAVPTPSRPSRSRNILCPARLSQRSSQQLWTLRCEVHAAHPPSPPSVPWAPPPHQPSEPPSFDLVLFSPHPLSFGLDAWSIFLQTMFLSLFRHHVALCHVRGAALGLSLPVRFQGWFYLLSLFPIFFSLPLPPVQLQASPLAS